jgi:serine/threonine protein kinase
VKKVCTTCERIWDETNLWCKTRTCTAGSLSVVFDYGEYLSDILIVRMIRVLRTATIYEAQRAGQRIMLKVAHDGCQEQLKREATTLAKLAQEQQHPMLPVLLPAYQFATGEQRPYGKTVYQNQTKYYMVFEFVEGEFLRDLLIKNPQPWYQHAAWMTISVADAIAFLHVKGGKLHLNINPESILIRTDKEGIPRPMLVDLGIVSEPQMVSPSWANKYAHPAYLPPELLERGVQPGPQADVYGLGVVLYEMLTGAPAYRFKMRSEDDVRRDVRMQPPPPVNRSDLSEDVANIVSQAIDRNPAARPADVRTFAKGLRVKFGEVPPEKKRRLITRRRVGIVLLVVLFVVVFILISALLPLLNNVGANPSLLLPFIR